MHGLRMSLLFNSFAYCSHVTNTYIIESLAAANAYHKLLAKKKMEAKEVQGPENDETTFDEMSLPKTEENHYETNGNVKNNCHNYLIKMNDAGDSFSSV